LKAEIVTKRPHLKKKKVLLHQDNAPVHTSAVAMVKIHELQFELIYHPPYSPDLSPRDFLLLPKLLSLEGLNRLDHREKKMHGLKRDSVEK
jgi:histone-lysine N-methyltransferase SETMAR